MNLCEPCVYRPMSQDLPGSLRSVFFLKSKGGRTLPTAQWSPASSGVWFTFMYCSICLLIFLLRIWCLYSWEFVHFSLCSSLTLGNAGLVKHVAIFHLLLCFGRVWRECTHFLPKGFMKSIMSQTHLHDWVGGFLPGLGVSNDLQLRQ